MPLRPPTADDSAEVDRYCGVVDVAHAMLHHPDDDHYRLRVFFELMRGAAAAGETAMQLFVDEPPPIGDPRFDALLAAGAEYVAERLKQSTPPWAHKPCRFLETQWWISDLPSGRAYARTGTHSAFKKRGIWLDKHDLSSA
ncbi:MULTISPECIES: hypothetical protein [Mycobacterium]|uniref:hypothetical protein n=1 Tax=Mycobacterium TaxID=1763 RepID=UPI000693749B|nr:MULTISPECIES: hypothetical protein [Mycobacterium]MCV7034880.1 hypothetical protein [Mycobacterium heckeshornense]